MRPPCARRRTGSSLSRSRQRQLRGPEQARHLRICREERVNIEAALAWASASDPALGLRIASRVWLGLGAPRRWSARFKPCRRRCRRRGVGVQRQGPGASTVVHRMARSDQQHRAGMQGSRRSRRRRQLDRRPVPGGVQPIGPGARADPERRPRPRLVGTRREPALLDEAHPWDLGGTWILSAHAALLRGDVVAASVACAEADRLLRPLGDDWALDHLDALLGYIAQAELRYADAATHLRRAAEAAGRLGTPPPRRHTLTRSVGFLNKRARSTKRSRPSNESSRSGGRHGSCACSRSAVSTLVVSCEATATAT